MGLAVDHVFVCCDVGAPEARALIDLGWPEGAPNTHPGQGTANRRFFFRNAYLELLWVTEAEEARSEMVGRTRLWERWSRRRSGACRFGVVLRREGANESDLPFRSWSYRPTYLPAGWAIEVARDLRLDEPELFYLDVPSSQPGALGSTHTFGREASYEHLNQRALRDASLGGDRSRRVPRPTVSSCGPRSRHSADVRWWEGVEVGRPEAAVTVDRLLVERAKGLSIVASDKIYYVK